MDQPVDHSAAISAFWSWWQANASKLKITVGTADFPQELIDGISTHVAAIHDELNWEFGKGTHAQHSFALSPNGDGALFGTVAAWRAAGPADDELFEFHTSKQRMHEDFLDSSLQLGPTSLCFADLRLSMIVDDQSCRIHTTVHHELFGQLPEQLLSQLLFIIVDNLFGETAVSNWIGNLEASADPAPEKLTPKAARALMDTAPAAWTGDAKWQILQGQDPETQEQVLLMIDMAARRSLMPEHDYTARIALDYLPGPNGLPTPDDFGAMREWSDGIEGAIGEQHKNVAVETGQGQRVLHFVMTADHAKEKAHIDAAVAAWGDGAHAEITYDPSWASVPRV